MSYHDKSPSRFRPADALDDVNTAGIGRIIGDSLKRTGILASPTSARYLAIGAGQAHPEIALAETLGIGFPHVTLLDKRFSSTARNRFSAIGFPGLIVEQDMNDFLGTPSEEKYDLASTFGMEYVFRDPQALQQLIQVLSTKMNVNGVVVMFPATENRALWERYGFSPLQEVDDKFYFAVFENPPTEER